MICYFREGLNPFIKVKMEQQDRESMDFKEMVQRTVNAETKAGLRSSTMVRPVAPEAIVYPTILLPRYKPKAPRTPTAPRNLNPRIRS